MTSRWDGVVLGSARTLFEAGTAIGRDDGELLDWFLATRSEAAFAALVARHGPMVLRVCRGASRDEQDAQDAFQATFLVLARRAGSIRRRESLASWLYGVARKIAVRARADATRRRWKERQAVSGATAEAPPDSPSADHTALYEEIDRLPGTYREPIILCYLDGMTYEAAARHLDCPLGTLSIRLKRARERLRSSLTRRGVAIPAGLLGVGLAPSLAPAAVPSALTTLAVRSALISVGSKAMVGGVVPTAVASMAGRMTSMMRFKTFAVGLLVFGGVVVAGAGSLAMKPTLAARTPAQEPAPAPVIEPRSWVRTFPNGTTVELIGISIHPSNPGSWRTPDGSPLANPPYDHAAYSTTTTRDREAYEVAFRVRDHPRKAENGQLQTVPPSRYSSSSQGMDAQGLSIPGIKSQSLTFAKDQASCSVRFGLAAGTWKTEATSSGRVSMGLALENRSVVFSSALEVGARTFITATRDHSEDELRLVAVDLEGNERRADGGESTGVENFIQIAREYNAPLAEIREFRLQSRPYEWMTFDDVSLKPRGEAGAPAQKKGGRMTIGPSSPVASLVRLIRPPAPWGVIPNDCVTHETICLARVGRDA